MHFLVVCLRGELIIFAPAGVGITSELPGDEEDTTSAGQQAAETGFEDPTERLAIALELQVCQLAHHTHKQPGNPLAAIHRLRCGVLQLCLCWPSGDRQLVWLQPGA